MQEFNATGGKITGTSFVDINGKRHEDWISNTALLKGEQVYVGRGSLRPGWTVAGIQSKGFE